MQHRALDLVCVRFFQRLGNRLRVRLERGPELREDGPDLLAERLHPLDYEALRVDEVLDHRRQPLKRGLDRVIVHLYRGAGDRPP